MPLKINSQKENVGTFLWKIKAKLKDHVSEKNNLFLGT